MGFFGSPKIDGDELQQCLAYIEASTMVIARQTKEADLYNNVMVKYSNSIKENPLAASEACKAVKRLEQVAPELVKQHEQIQPVPAAASASHYAWYVTLQANVAWASATAAAIQAMAEGMNPSLQYVQEQLTNYQKAQRTAEAEDKKFVKRLNVSAEDMAKIITRATT